MARSEIKRMSTSGKAQSKNAPKNKGKHVSATPPRTISQSKKFRAAGQPAGSTSSNMLGENRYTPNPTNADPFAPLPPFPDTKTKMDNDCERSSVSDNDDSAQAEKPKPAPGKKTRGRVRIQMEYIQNKLRRYTTFSKRKSGIMKKVILAFCRCERRRLVWIVALLRGPSLVDCRVHCLAVGTAVPFGLISLPLPPTGVRTEHADRNTGDAAGGLRDRPRLHLRDAQAAADDHQRGGEGTHPNLPTPT